MTYRNGIGYTFGHAENIIYSTHKVINYCITEFVAISYEVR